MKAQGSTLELAFETIKPRGPGEVSGIPSVEVKFVDIRRNTRGEGDSLDRILTLRCESVGSKQD